MTAAIVGGLRSRSALHQLGRFLVVGVANTLVSFVAYRILLAAGVGYVVAAPIAYAVGVVNGYVFNSRWTFGARDSAGTMARYLVVQGGGAALTSLLVHLLVQTGASKTTAFVVAIPPVTLSTFVANRLWAFADRPR